MSANGAARFTRQVARFDTAHREQQSLEIPRVEIRGTLDINSHQFATVPDAQNPHKQRPFAYFAYIRSNWQQIASLQLLTEGL
jgi:hypothetical protein